MSFEEGVRKYGSKPLKDSDSFMKSELEKRRIELKNAKQKSSCLYCLTDSFED